MPLTSSFVVACVDDLVSEFDVTHELVLVDDAFEVFADLHSRCVERRPVVLIDGSNAGQMKSNRTRTFSSKDS